MNKTITKSPVTTKPTPVIKYPVIELKGRGTVIITDYVQKRINMLHEQIGSTEWCAFITYDKVSGSINDPANFIVKIADIYPMGIGSETYTESDNHASELSKMDQRIPSYFMSRTGFCHTHHDMKTFFSGTDLQELHNNVDKYDGDSYYLSLIVNFAKVNSCKVVKLVDIPANKAVYNETGTEHTMEFPAEKVMIMFDLDVKIEENIIWNDDVMQTRIDELKAEVVANEAKAAAKQLSYGRAGITAYRDWNEYGYGYGKQIALKLANNDKKLNREYATFLKMALSCSDKPTKEIGQILMELTKLSPDDFDTRLDDIGQYLITNSYDEFGEDCMSEGINKCKSILKTYLGAPKWKSEVEHLVEVFENCAEDLVAYEINGEIIME